MNETLTGKEALKTLEAYSQHHRREGETYEAAFLRACGEQTGMYLVYDRARMREGKAMIAPHPPKTVAPDTID